MDVRARTRSALEQLVSLHETFRGASQRQRRALIEHDVDGLTVILTEMENLADEIFLVDSRRRMHMEILSESDDREILNLKELALLWPSMDFSPLSAAADRLRTLRAEIEQLTRVNTALINASRQLVQTTVEAIVRAPLKADTVAQKTYGSTGSMNRDKSPARNLINRKG